MTGETSADIDRQAAAWAARFDRDLSAREEALLEDWLSGDARRLGAYARARAVAEHSRRAAGLAGGIVERRPAPVSLSRRSLAASLVALGVGGAAVATAVFRGPRFYETEIGEVRDVELPDGSRMTLSPLTRVGVRYRDDNREVMMEIGEALFTVADEMQRPFLITTDNVTVAAVGGRLLMKRLHPSSLEVTALDGTAQVRLDSDAPTRLEAGQQLNLAQRRAQTYARIEPAQSLNETEVERALAWRDGQLAFHNDTLRDATVAFSRFSARQIEVSEPAVGALRITGLFDARDPLTFAYAAAVSLDLRVSMLDDRIVLFPA